MSNSLLVQFTLLSPNCNKPRNHAIDKITIHHMAGVLSVESCGNIFVKPTRKASSNYGIGSDGRIGLYCEEKNRSWCSSSPSNDHRAVTIEVSNDQVGGVWHISDYVLDRLVDLCVDICKRNGIQRLNYTGDTSGNLTLHKWFAATACPGPYLEGQMVRIADAVNLRLSGDSTAKEPEPTPHQVAGAESLDRSLTGVYITTDELNVRYVPGLIRDDNIVKVAKKDDTVQCYGYYSTVDGVKWLYVAYAGITGYVNSSYLKLRTADDARIKKGDRVKIKPANVYNGRSVTYDGKSFRLYYDAYDVLSVNGSRVVIGIGKVTTAAVNAAILQKI